ncbi:MAG: hypothetical protein AVDCRST_MAG16-684, partial [uncultured Frankineae bacterium]
ARGAGAGAAALERPRPGGGHRRAARVGHRTSGHPRPATARAAPRRVA